jgi:signal peptidase
MKQSQRRPSAFLNIILFTGLVLVWIAFAPARIGGQASYVMVNGVSMEPGYHTGDLVIVRKAETYQVGDVVTYRDAEMGAYVIHRIIAIEQGQVILQGDNNSWIDAYHPAPDEIIGKQWIHVPKLGRMMQWLRAPVNLSLTILLLGGVLMTGMISKPPHGQKGKSRPATRLGGMFEGALTLLGLLFLGFLGLSIFAFTRPLTRTAGGIPYQQESNYFYSAAGTPGVYDTEMVRSGEPVFPKLTCFLNIGFTYNILGGPFQDVTGSHQMYARIMDEESGWQRTIPLIQQTAFTGASYSTMTSLDLCQLTSLVNLVEKETSLHANAYTIEIVTDIAFTAGMSGQIIRDTFDPTLAFKFNKVHLYLADTNAESNPMHITKQGLAVSSNVEANTLSLPGWEPTIGSIRVFALLGLGMSLGGLVIMGFLVFNATRQNEEVLIRLRYGSLLMDVYEQNLERTSSVIDVTSIKDLANLAERQNTMILHMTLNFLHYYMVQSNGVTYRYVTSSGKSGMIEIEPARQEVFGYVIDSGATSIVEAEPAWDEVLGFSINMGRNDLVKAGPEHKEILRKITL